MHQRIAVDLACGRQEEAGPVGLGNAQRVVRAQRARLHGLNWQIEVGTWGLRVGTGRRREMQDRVDMAANENVVGDVVPIECESFVSHEVGDVLGAAGHKVVQTQSPHDRRR